MLDEASKRLASFTDRVTLVHGFADDAPNGPFDAATSLLTLHFLNERERLRTVTEIVRRLRPGAPFVAVHCSFPQDPAHRGVCLDRHEAYSVAAGMDPNVAREGRASIAESLNALEPEQDERILTECGLTNVSLFYAAFTWRGWVGYAQ